MYSTCTYVTFLATVELASPVKSTKLRLQKVYCLSIIIIYRGSTVTIYEVYVHSYTVLVYVASLVRVVTKLKFRMIVTNYAYWISTRSALQFFNSLALPGSDDKDML